MAANQEPNLTTSEALEAYFDWYSPEEAKAKLWQLFTVAVTGHFDRLSLTEKENLVTFYEKVRDLIEGIAPDPAPQPPEGGVSPGPLKGEVPPDPLKGEDDRNDKSHE